MTINNYPTRLAAVTLSMLFFLTANSYAQVYKTIDDQGNPAFSDQATDGELVDIEATNTVPAVNPSLPPNTDQQNDPFERYLSLAIASPANEGIIANGLSPFIVSVVVKPALRQGHKLILTIDGDIYSQGDSTQLTVDKISRGNHTIQASIINQRGQTLITSANSSFFVYWPGNR